MLTLAETVRAAPPYLALGVMLCILVASALVFVVLVKRWTTHRWRTAMVEWARPRRLSVKFATDSPTSPAIFTPISKHGSRTLLQLQSDTIDILQIETREAPAGQESGPFRWNLLVRKIETRWPATGLRPVVHRTSALDFFSLSSFPSLGETDRFVVFGTDSTPARSLSKSMGRALLPPDVGLLMAEGFLILDFSTRPFDTIEFGRMIALADQLAGKLPAPA